MKISFIFFKPLTAFYSVLFLPLRGSTQNLLRVHLAKLVSNNNNFATIKI